MLRPMKRAALALAVLVPLGVAALAGCAVGEASEDPSVDYLSSTPSDTDAQESDDESTVIAPSKPTTPSDEKANDDDAKDAGAPDASKPDADAGVGNPGDAGTPGDSGTPSGSSCAAPNTCAGATHLGAVSGDTGADVKTASGSTSQWFTIDVTEDDNSLFGMSLWFTATLTSPPGTNFDLFLYLPEKAGARECSAVSASSTSTSDTDALPVEWGESSSGLSNGSNDGRTMTVEVRHVSGTCNPSQKWSLKLEGNK